MRRGLLVLLVLLLHPTTAQAATYTVDFESSPPAIGTPIEDDYVAAAFVRFIGDDPGFRPARRQVTGDGVAADVGPSRCVPDGFMGSDCEFVTGGTTFNLTRTASSLTVDAGLFTDNGGNAVDVQLQAYRAGEVAPFTSSAVVPVSYNGAAFDDTVTVTSGAADIQKVVLVVTGLGASGSEIGFDDLVVEYPDGTVPDFTLSMPPNTVVVPQGGSVDVPVTITRVNGSDGNLDAVVTGEPAGVTGTVTPDPVPGTTGSATLHLTATDTATPDFAGQPVTVKLTPAGAAVGPAPHSATVTVSVRSPFNLVVGAGPHLVPQCTPYDVPLVVAREFNFSTSKTVTLSAQNLPAGVTAEFVPSATVAPGGGLNAEVKLRLTRPASAQIPLNWPVQVTATAPGAPTRTLLVPIGAATPTATLDQTTLRGAVPSRLREGSRIRLNGNGFCPGTKVRVGNALAEVDTEPDGTTGLYFRLPRLATTGPVTVVPPGAATYNVTSDLTVDSPRNTTGFQFDNPGWGNLSFGEITDLVGAQEMFLEINPCWPVYDCSIPTAIPDPLAYIKWQAIEQAAQSSGGHCFGINRFVQEIGAGRIRASDFAGGVGKVFDLPNASAPVEPLESYLDERHAGQFTTQFIAAYLTRSTSLATQLQRARDELAANRLPGIIVKPSLFKGHVVTAHDIETLPDGSTIIHLYDNETPFLPGEVTDRSGDAHKNAENASTITINAAKTGWSYSDWSGGGGSFMTTTLNDWPGGTSPSLPGLDKIAAAVLFGSRGGAAVSQEPAEGTELLPALDRRAIEGAAGAVIAPVGEAIEHGMTGVKKGSYTQTYMANGFVGVVDAPTGAGIEDTVTGDRREITFEGEKTRPVELTAGFGTGNGGRVATIDTHSTGGGSDAAGMTGNALVYEHDGAPTTMSLTLETATPGKGVASFRSGPIPVPGDATLKVKPSSWQTLGSVRLTTRAKGRRTQTRKLRNRTAKVPIRLSLKRLRVSGGKGRVTLRVRRTASGAVGGVVLRLLRKGKAVAKRGFSIRALRKGSFKYALDLPKLRRGTYVLRADAIGSVVGNTSGSQRVFATRRFRP